MESVKESFNDEFRKRTKQNALAIIRLYSTMKSRDELRIIGKQIIRSGCSVAANFRASCRARSQAEHYSKLCIVVEECDETFFWLEMIEATGTVDPGKILPIKEETLRILMVLSKARKNLKN